MFSTTHDAILVILVVALAVWQASLLIVAHAMIRSGQYRKVDFGTGPGILACILLIVAVLW